MGYHFDIVFYLYFCYFVSDSSTKLLKDDEKFLKFFGGILKILNKYFSRVCSQDLHFYTTTRLHFSAM